MNGPLLLLLLLFLISASAAGKTWRTTDDTARYCRICPDHTMCRFPDDEPGLSCVAVSSTDLDDVEIEWLLLRHNSLRKASGGDAKIIWDDELARLAARWSLQCKLHETDSCRDVGRFAVRQRVNAMELTGPRDKRTSLQRLMFHVGTWNDVPAAASKKASTSGQLTTRLGCARAIYSVDIGEERPVWVETLVCNYGPIETDVVPRDEPGRVNATTASAVRIATTRRRLVLAGYLFLPLLLLLLPLGPARFLSSAWPFCAAQLFQPPGGVQAWT